MEIETLIGDVLGVDSNQVSDSLAMKESDRWDSLKHMELIVALEQTFQVELTFDEIVAMRTVGEIRRILGEKGALT